MVPVEELERKLGYTFLNRQLLTNALTHRSRVSELGESAERTDNERLEFLGDAVLGFVVSEELVQQNPTGREGLLSRLKSHLVSSTHLHSCALEIGLGEYVLLGKGEELSGGRERKSLLADAMEALIAALYLDGGMEPARAFIHHQILKEALQNPEQVDEITQLNHKSLLQETAQTRGLPSPRYVTVGSSGPEHAKQFMVEARIGDQLAAKATGSSKKIASQSAAKLLLTRLNAAESEERSTDG
jgi:ribonuclease-3